MNELLIHGRQLAGPFLIALDLLGTFVFALAGAAAGVKNKLDLFGLIVLGFATGTAGGIARDLLIGSVPPASIHDWRYMAICVLAGWVVFLWYPKLDAHRRPVLLLDAAGLALFAVTGTQKSLAAGLNPFMAAILGMLSGIGGGMLRDILVNETPVVLRADLYAVAALAAGAIVVGGHALHFAPHSGMVAGALLCFFLRLMAIYRNWHLPMARTPASSTP